MENALFHTINSEQNIFLVGQRCLLVRTDEIVCTIHHPQTKTFSYSLDINQGTCSSIKKKKLLKSLTHRHTEIEVRLAIATTSRTWASRRT